MQSGMPCGRKCPACGALVYAYYVSEVYKPPDYIGLAKMLLANSRSEPRCAFADHVWGIARIVSLLRQCVRSAVPISVRCPSLGVEGYGRCEGWAPRGGSPATS
jgi:hypothetical protein